MQIYEVWEEGYLVTGMEGVPSPAHLLGKVEANSFKEACDKLCSSEEFQRRNGRYDPEKLTVWGCRLFDNKHDASKFLG